MASVPRSSHTLRVTSPEKCCLYARVSRYVEEWLQGGIVRTVSATELTDSGMDYNFVCLPCTNSRTHKATFLLYRETDTDRQTDSCKLQSMITAVGFT